MPTRVISTAAVLALLICASPGARATVELAGTSDTHNVRQHLARELRQADEPLPVKPVVIRDGRRLGEYWWQASRAMALLDGPMPATRRRAFERQRGYSPLVLPVAATAATVVVNGDNPLADGGISVEKLEHLFAASAEPDRPLRFWGQLGLKGYWELRPVVVIVVQGSATTDLFVRRVLQGATLDPRVRKARRGMASLVEEVARERRALGIASPGAGATSVAWVPVSRTEDGPAVAPTDENIRTGRYPLADCLRLYLDQPPGERLGPDAAAVLRYLWSEAGQRVLAEHGYVPLSPASWQAARAWLDSDPSISSAEEDARPRCEASDAPFR